MVNLKYKYSETCILWICILYNKNIGKDDLIYKMRDMLLLYVGTHIFYVTHEIGRNTILKVNWTTVNNLLTAVKKLLEKGVGDVPERLYW